MTVHDGGFKHTAQKAEHISKGSVLALTLVAGRSNGCFFMVRQPCPGSLSPGLLANACTITYLTRWKKRGTIRFIPELVHNLASALALRAPLRASNQWYVSRTVSFSRTGFRVILLLDPFSSLPVPWVIRAVLECVVFCCVLRSTSVGLPVSGAHTKCAGLTRSTETVSTLPFMRIFIILPLLEMTLFG